MDHDCAMLQYDMVSLLALLKTKTENLADAGKLPFLPGAEIKVVATGAGRGQAP